MSKCTHDWRELDESEKCWTCGSERPLSDASDITPLVYRGTRITFWNKLAARLTNPLVREHIESLWEELDSARFHLSWYTNGNAEMQRRHYSHEVDVQRHEIAEHKEHISHLRHLLWSAEQELRELRSNTEPRRPC